MESKEIITHSAAETQQVGEQLAQRLPKGTVILLDGDLGAGKTTFTKGLATGLGIKQLVRSPTFTIMREYHDGRLPLYHMDAYRLENGGGADLGLEEYFDSDGVLVIEWSQWIADLLPADYLRVSLKRADQEDEATRTVTLTAHGTLFVQLVATLKRPADE
ncbi:ATPase YjeE, predicted to have essential role in cell wall biosynthesis [Fructilactobacillus florum 8D]|uniref:tRNA threonylcarbamoyladenosine biosynthesis protein TsaE n=1 Tax=Fructilactobacillus florum 8D TaxID=1221538 RepID=W9EE16_9LACO|nr:tRNA (adenosine(37)-N6)-threonylcarbamoyltransferase complex ATPase subunit type 1 TsaE [Fructilactobacillus florum]ETO40332.1 ATPase YjeE, predicted to have essential role in cell wall biosynthesis [Fructilactobacillus florum 8D]